MSQVQTAKPKEGEQSGKLGRPEEGRQAGTLKRSGYRVNRGEYGGPKAKRQSSWRGWDTNNTPHRHKGSWVVQKGLIQ